MKLQPWEQFVGPSYPAQSVFLDSSRTVNFYLEAIESGGSRFALIGTPGKDLFFSLVGSSRTRGAILGPDGYVYFVSGATLYRLYNRAGTGPGMYGTGLPAALALLDDGHPVSLAASTTELLVISAGLGYIYTFATGVLTQIADPDFPANAIKCDYVDGYFLVLAQVSDGDYLYISALRNGTSWDALDRTTVESSTNRLVSLLVDHREVWVFGGEMAQVFNNTGADFPFEPTPAGVVHQGCAARFSPARLDNSIFWLGSDERGAGIVWRAQGYTPQRISNHAVEHAIRNYATISDAVAYAYQWDGHSFYKITFPTAQATWVYDVATGNWHEELYWNADTGQYEADLALFHVYAYGQHLVFSRENGHVFMLSATTYTDAIDSVGTPRTLRRLRRAPHLNASGSRIIFDAFGLDVEPGLGLVAGQGSDPLFLLRTSNDGGKTFNQVPDREVRVGAMGRYGYRPRTTRLGSARDRVFEAVFTDPIPWRITGAGLAVRETND